MLLRRGLHEIWSPSFAARCRTKGTTPPRRPSLRGEENRRRHRYGPPEGWLAACPLPSQRHRTTRRLALVRRPRRRCLGCCSRERRPNLAAAPPARHLCPQLPSNRAPFGVAEFALTMREPEPTNRRRTPSGLPLRGCNLDSAVGCTTEAPHSPRDHRHTHTHMNTGNTQRPWELLPTPGGGRGEEGMRNMAAFPTSLSGAVL